jgi:RNA polymerase sigma factor (sigma-70 family)
MTSNGAVYRPDGMRAATAGERRLTLTQERALLSTSRHGADDATRQRAQSELWHACHGLVASVAQRHRRTGIELADLIGAGQLGLHAAIVRFDPDRFAGRLSTYAVPWIRWYIQDHISRNTGPVRLPSTTAHRQLTRWGARLFDEARRDCQRERVPSTEMELCTRVGRRIGLSADDVARRRLTQTGATVAVDTLPDFGGDANRDDHTPEDSVIRRLDHEKLRRRILALAESVLGERERTVFLARCMTGNRPIVQLDTLAARFGVSRERIYQLEGSARRKIVTALGSDGITRVPDRPAAPLHQPGRRRAAV